MQDARCMIQDAGSLDPEPCTMNLKEVTTKPTKKE
jgi:hypothetical protein